MFTAQYKRELLCPAMNAFYLVVYPGGRPIEASTNVIASFESDVRAFITKPIVFVFFFFRRRSPSFVKMSSESLRVKVLRWQTTVFQSLIQSLAEQQVKCHSMRILWVLFLARSLTLLFASKQLSWGGGQEAHLKVWHALSERRRRFCSNWIGKYDGWLWWAKQRASAFPLFL